MNAEQHNDTLHNVVLCYIVIYCYAECHYTYRHFAECQHIKCPCAQRHNIECRFGECCCTNCPTDFRLLICLKCQLKCLCLNWTNALKLSKLNLLSHRFYAVSPFLPFISLQLQKKSFIFTQIFSQIKKTKKPYYHENKVNISLFFTLILFFCSCLSCRKFLSWRHWQRWEPCSWLRP